MVNGQGGEGNDTFCISRYNRAKMVDIPGTRDSRRREFVSKQSDGRKRQYDVAQATGMEEEDLHYSIIIVF